MTDKITEAVARAIRKAQARDPYMMFDYSGYDGEEPPHVIRDAKNNIVFRSNDRDECAKEYNRLNEAHAATAAIAAYREAVASEAVAWTDADNLGDVDRGEVGMMWPKEDWRPNNHVPLFAAPPAQTPAGWKLVTVKSDANMQRAGTEAIEEAQGYLDDAPGKAVDCRAILTWDAMLAAAPAPESNNV